RVVGFKGGAARLISGRRRLPAVPDRDHGVLVVGINDDVDALEPFDGRDPADGADQDVDGCPGHQVHHAAAAVVAAAAECLDQGNTVFRYRALLGASIGVTRENFTTRTFGIRLVAAVLILVLSIHEAN